MTARCCNSNLSLLSRNPNLNFKRTESPAFFVGTSSWIQHDTRQKELSQEDHLPMTQESKHQSLAKSSGSQFPGLQRKTLISKDLAMIWHEWVT